jgi:hypothetical protein
MLLVVTVAVSLVPGAFTTPWRSFAGAAAAFASALPLLAVIAIHDLGRVEVARGGRFYEAVAAAVSLARRRPLALAWALASAAALGVGAAAAGLSAPFVIGVASGPRLVGVVLVEQASIVALVIVRARYFVRLAAIARDASRSS